MFMLKINDCLTQNNSAFSTRVVTVNLYTPAAVLHL